MKIRGTKNKPNNNNNQVAIVFFPKFQWISFHSIKILVDFRCFGEFPPTPTKTRFGVDSSELSIPTTNQTSSKVKRNSSL